MIKWRDPSKELPEEGEIVAVITQHWKAHNPRSCIIYFGEVQYSKSRESCRVQTDDFTGEGSFSISLRQLNGEVKGFAWCPSSELTLPKNLVPHDTHWGKYIP